YYIAVVGITGMRDSLPEDVMQNISKLKQMTNTPIAVGFGVSTPVQAKLIGKTADGVIVGSAIVKEIERHANDSREVLLRSVGGFVGDLILGAKG
ncbi:MAG: tryptophan synthase subunit alpha, partial [Planctomycetes bacterium]|nr:tryptophan synthase subunit alpha [Planctomycetota bacterium]